MSWFILFCYVFFAYGCSLIVTQGEGPKGVFARLRDWAEDVGPNFGLLFRCMMCFPANLGLFFSLLNWFLLPVAITPFNMVFAAYRGTFLMSIVACILDACFTSAVCHIIFNVEDFVDKSTPVAEDDYDSDGRLWLHD